ncbi:hypothetical protein V2G26_011426 [Clonostachys chloroleuca]
MAWTELPTEIRLMILQVLVEDDDCNFADLAVVSKEWQGVIEQQNFQRIRLTPPRIAELDTMTLRHRNHVRYLWFCLELEQYNCPECAPELISSSVSTSDNTLIEAAFHHLFSVISTWAPDNRLTLDISVYSTSDRDNWFKYLTLEPDAPPKAENEWCGQLPQVPEVKRILLRQQTRRRWYSEGLAEIFAHLPRLSELCYEPWRDWDAIRQEIMDENFLDLLQSLPLRRLSSLSIFENFNQRYTHAYLQMDCSDIRAPNPDISQMLSGTSINFEHLSASFMVDLLAPDKSHTGIMDMLREAALRCVCMPQLETMDIWNGRVGLAAVFRYDGRTRSSILEWRSTWDTTLGLSVIRAWEAASMKRSGHGVELVYGWLDSENILSHADATLALDFPELVIRPISLHQIRREYSWRRIALT